MGAERKGKASETDGFSKARSRYDRSRSAVQAQHGAAADDAAHGPLLPPSWRTLYELTKLPDELLFAKFAAGEIWPEMQRKDVARDNRLISKSRDKALRRAVTARPLGYRG